MADIPSTRASLLVRLRDSRDEAAWTEFVDLYAPLIYGYLRRQGLQDADAMDVSQEVISTIARAVSRLAYDPKRGSFRNWLFTVVRRKLSNWRRAQRSRPDRNANAATNGALEQCPAADQQDAVWEDEWEQRLFAWACAQVRPEVADHTWQAFWR